MQELALVLARFDQVLLAREPIDNLDPDPGLAYPIAQLGSEVPLDLLAREPSHSLEERGDVDFGTAVGDQGPLRRDRVARIPLAHHHLIGAQICARAGHDKCFADRPEAEQPDAELALLPTALPTASDRHCARLGVDAVLD